MLRAVGGYVGFVEGGSVIDGVDAFEALTDEVAVDNGANALSICGFEDIDAEDGLVSSLQGPDHGFAKMAGAAGDERLHGVQGKKCLVRSCTEMYNC